MQGSRDAPPSLKNDVDMDASSADVNANTNVSADPLLMPPLSEEAKKKRRQEINRESARRVRKRKTEAHVQLQEEVVSPPGRPTSFCSKNFSFNVQLTFKIFLYWKFQDALLECECNTSSEL